jgi:hypothetical protein
VLDAVVREVTVQLGSHTPGTLEAKSGDGEDRNERHECEQDERRVQAEVGARPHPSQTTLGTGADVILRLPLERDEEAA